jgi:hypothetical protein
LKPLLRSLGYFFIQVAGVMIAAELAQRRFVQLKKNLAQCFGLGMPGSETLSINLAQRVDRRVSVLVADFTVVVAVAIVETCFAHAALLVPQATASSRRDRMAILRSNTSGRDLLNHPARLGRPTFPARQYLTNRVLGVFRGTFFAARKGDR